MTAAPLDIISLDDDADFREYIGGSLGAHGHDVRTVSDPAELYNQCAFRLPDVVLLDMNMGAHEGAHVLQEIRVRWPELCVVVVTGFPSMETMRETFKQQVFDYIAKPFHVEQLLGVLGQAADTLGLGQTPLERLRDRLGRGIRLARTREQWTLKDLSKKSGVSVSQLSSIERGTHLPSLESLVAIAGALDARASDWLAEVGL
ncbi:MAG: response regulator [Planctomycetota bacterium]